MKLSRLGALPVVLAFAGALAGCASTSSPFADDAGEALTPQEIEFQKRLAQTEAQPLDAAGRADLMVTLDRSLSTWFRSSLEAAGSTNRQLVDNLEDVLQRTVYKNFDAVLEVFQHGDPEQREVAAAALGFARLQEPANPEQRQRFLDHWPQVYRRAIDPLIAGLSETDPTLVQNCLLALWKLGDPETPLDPVLRHLHTTDPEIRSNAMLALSTILTPETGEKAIDQIINALYDANPKVRNHAVTVIAHIRHPDAAGRLAQLLDDNYLLIQANAALALGAIGDVRNCSHLVSRLERLSAETPSGKFRKKSGLDYGRERVRDSLTTALQQLSGKDFGDDPVKWREWWNTRRATSS